MALPEDLAPALMDGVVLCHLANHVRPRSVVSIHVPSPAVVSIILKLYNYPIATSQMANGKFNCAIYQLISAETDNGKMQT